MCLRNLLYVMMELLCDLPTGVTLLVFCGVNLQVRVNKTGNTTSGETLLHLSKQEQQNNT